METVLYKVMNLAQIELDKQTVTTNNLANVNTTGFRSDLYQAQTVYVQSGSNSNEAFVVPGEIGVDFSNGELMTTGRDLDVAVQGDGWFAVQSDDGHEAYTRAGDFRLTENGILVTGSGRPVLGDGGPISIPPAQRIEIGNDGTISILPLEADPNELAVLDRLKLVKIDNNNLVKGEDGLMRLQKGGTAIPDTNITVVNGALEGSNVSAVDQMVRMIAAGRQFETQMKIVQTVDENAQKLAQVLHE